MRYPIMIFLAARPNAAVLLIAVDVKRMASAFSPKSTRLEQRVVRAVRCLSCALLLWRPCVQTLQLSDEQIGYLCEEATRAGTQGQRAEIFACEVARASAGESKCSRKDRVDGSPSWLQSHLCLHCPQRGVHRVLFLIALSCIS